jgi:hypothetical protein
VIADVLYVLIVLYALIALGAWIATVDDKRVRVPVLFVLVLCVLWPILLGVILGDKALDS